jgi:hypothetical protein
MEAKDDEACMNKVFSSKRTIDPIEKNEYTYVYDAMNHLYDYTSNGIRFVL